MNALQLFHRIINPTLWLQHNVIGLGAGMAISGGLGALGGLLGGGDSGGTPITARVGKAFKPFRNSLGNFLNQDPRGFFPDQTFTDQSPFTQNAIQGLGNFSTQPSQDLFQQTINGDFLGASPQVQQSLLNPATQATNAAFSQLGRFGSQANANETSAAGIRALLPLFEAERGRQQQAAQLLPLAQQTELQNQLQGGGLQEQFNQQGINENMQRFNFDPILNQLNQASPALTTLFGGSTAQQPQAGGSALSGLLGGGLLGLQVGQSLFGNTSGGGGGSAGLLANSGGFGGGGNGADALNLAFSRPFQF